MKLYLLIGLAMYIITEITMWVHTWDIIKEAYDGFERFLYVAGTAILDFLLYILIWPIRVICIVITMCDNWEYFRTRLYFRLVNDEEES